MTYERRVIDMENPLVTLRKSKKLSQVEFSNRAGLSCATLQALELGRSNMMRDSTAEIIARFTGRRKEEIQSNYRKWKDSLRDAE